MVHAGVHSRSFDKAAADVAELAELNISGQRIMRATKKIGAERIGERKAEVRAYAELAIPERHRSPVAQTPRVACVEMDGGRIQIRDRLAPEPSEASEECGRKGRFWRESRVGVLLSMASAPADVDPCPALPEVFLDQAKMRRIVGEIKGFSSDVPAAEAVSREADADETAPRPGLPEPLVKTVVATRQSVDDFALTLATAAWRRGFHAAERKAFLADGAEANWSAWRQQFSHYTPILDFIHALCYVYAAAHVGRRGDEGWSIYCQWAQWVWSGQVQRVIAALEERQRQLGPPTDADGEETPRRVVTKTLGYLSNQASRMKYDQYRRDGLPITTSHVESMIKQINLRIKGTEKFWSTGGGDALLQLSADAFSDTQPLAAFWLRRQSKPTGHRHYQAAAA